MNKPNIQIGLFWEWPVDEIIADSYPQQVPKYKYVTKVQVLEEFSISTRKLNVH